MKETEITEPELMEKYYNEAKNIFLQDKQKAISLINQLPKEYLEGFMAFQDALEKNEDLIRNRVVIIKTAYELDMDHICVYVDRLLRVAHSVVNVYPEIAMEIYTLIKELPDDECVGMVLEEFRNEVLKFDTL